MLVVPSSAELLNTVLGALRVGIVPVPVYPSLTPAELDGLVADAQPALVVREGAVLTELEASDPVDIADVPLARPMHYTSGTTGMPKGVWSGVLDDGAARALLDEEAALWEFERGDRHLVCSPLHHSAPIRFAAGTLLAGGEVTVLDRFDPAAFAAAVAELEPTTAFLVPAHLQRLRQHGLQPVSSFRLLTHAGAPCPAPLKRWAHDIFGRRSVWEFYGSTEGQFTACTAEEWENRPGTVGRARPGRRLSTDRDGTIWCEVPDHARFTYWRDPERTAEAWRDGAFTVGDLGRLDEDGYLWLEGRRDDLIISGGVNVYPAEVERALADAPGVAEVAVFAVDDDRWGQRVCAAVVGGTTAEDVLRFAEERLAPFKRPKQVVVVGELPRTGMGKVVRRELERLLPPSTTGT